MSTVDVANVDSRDMYVIALDGVSGAPYEVECFPADRIRPALRTV